MDKKKGYYIIINKLKYFENIEFSFNNKIFLEVYQYRIFKDYFYLLDYI